MNETKIISLLNRVLNGNGKKLTKQNEYMFWSPFISHHKPKLQINVNTGKWHCWVSNNGGHNLYNLFKKLNVSTKYFDELKELTKDDDWQFQKQIKKDSKTILSLPNEFKPFYDSKDSIVKKHALKYLNNRGVTSDDILKYNIGYCDSGTYANRIIIPSYDCDGNLNFFVGRDFYNSKMKYRNSPTSKNIIGFELLINWKEPITLVEGPLDAITVRRNCIPLFGKTIMSQLYHKIISENVKVVYICLDNDAISDSLKIIDKLLKEDIDVRFIKLNEKDPNDIGFESFLHEQKKAEKMDFYSLIKHKLNEKPMRLLVD